MQQQRLWRFVNLRVAGLALVTILFLLWPGLEPVEAGAPPATPAESTLATNYLYFIENRGQLDRQVFYYLQGKDKTFYFTATGLTMTLTPPESATHPAERWVVKLDFVGASRRPVGQVRQETVVSYFKGTPDQWHTGLSTYARLVYPDLWPGIDLVYTTANNVLKYQFIVRPGADPGQIQLAYRGVTSLQLTEAGQLDVITPAGRFQDAAPAGYQMVDGRRAPVALHYRPATSPNEGRWTYGFQLGPYDPAYPLVLDPAFIVYAGFIGGTQRDNGYGVAVDTSGNAYVTGETRSHTDFPAVVGPDLSHNGGPYYGDAFIAKVRADGTGLVYAGFLGGSDEDYGYDVAVDTSGNAYVTGITNSNNFYTPGAADPIYNGGGDAFVAKVNAAGTGLVYVTYIGSKVTPSAYEVGRSIAVDSSGSAYVLVDSTDGPYSGDDTSVIKVNAAGSSFDYIEYLGGDGVDRGDSLAISGGNVYLTGQTFSTNLATAGAYDTTYNGGGDAFVIKLKSTIPRLVYATYIGDVVNSSSAESGEGIAVDSSGNTYILVDISAGPHGGYDTSVVKLNAAGTALSYIEYIGGSNSDFGSDLALDSLNRVYISGNTASTDFPVTGWLPYGYDAPQEAFVARLSASGSLVDAGFIAGEGTGSAGIAFSSQGYIYVAGTNWRGDDFPALIGPDLSANGERDAFVMKIAPSSIPVYLPVILK